MHSRLPIVDWWHVFIGISIDSQRLRILFLQDNVLQPDDQLFVPSEIARSVNASGGLRSMCKVCLIVLFICLVCSCIATSNHQLSRYVFERNSTTSMKRMLSKKFHVCWYGNWYFLNGAFGNENFRSRARGDKMALYFAYKCYLSGRLQRVSSYCSMWAM